MLWLYTLKFLSEILKLKLKKKKYFEKATASVMQFIFMYQNRVYLLFEQFTERFNPFSSLEQTIKLIEYLDVGVYSTSELKDSK